MAQCFSEIIGHQDIIGHLKEAIRQGRVSHAYLLTGEKGSGRRMMAGAFAMALECRESLDDACLVCESCRKARHQSHPDIIYVTHEKSGVITVDEIREQVVNTAALKPYESPYKIYIIPDADKMNVQAQNALLKTLEEPPAYAVFMLLSVSAEALLPTIVSRCTVLDIRPLSQTAVKEFLIRQHSLPDYEAEIAAAFSQGNIGRAREAVLSEEFMMMTERIVILLRRIEEASTVELVDFIRILTAEKQNIQEYLDMLTIWFRDVLMYKATREIDRLIFKKEISDIREQAEKASYHGIQEILESLDKAGARLRANVSFELTMELLLLSIRENLNG